MDLISIGVGVVVGIAILAGLVFLSIRRPSRSIRRDPPAADTSCQSGDDFSHH